MTSYSTATKVGISLSALGVAVVLGSSVAELKVLNQLSSLPPESPERKVLEVKRSDWSSAQFSSLYFTCVVGMGTMAQALRDERRARGVSDSSRAGT